MDFDVFAPPRTEVLGYFQSSLPDEAWAGSCRIPHAHIDLGFIHLTLAERIVRPVGDAFEPAIITFQLSLLRVPGQAAREEEQVIQLATARFTPMPRDQIQGIGLAGNLPYAVRLAIEQLASIGIDFEHANEEALLQDLDFLVAKFFEF